MHVDIIIPSLGHEHLQKCLDSLVHIPFKYELHVISEGNSWPEAVNIGFSKSDRDVILMDDDVQILPETFKNFEKYYDKADIFGFLLLHEDGSIQHSGAIISVCGISNDTIFYNEPLYVGHVTTSLCFIKREVIDTINGISEDYKGIQFEDVDFNFRAQDAGFKILYLPFKAYHYESQTKGNDPEFNNKSLINLNELRNRFDNNFTRFMYRIPLGDK